MQWRKEALSGQMPGLALQKAWGSEYAFRAHGRAAFRTPWPSEPFPHSPSRHEVEKVVSCEYTAPGGRGALSTS